MRADDLVRNPRCVLIAALLLASAGAWPQEPEPGADEPPGMDVVQEGCTSVVLVRCAQPDQPAPQQAQTTPADSGKADTQRKLQARRLRQAQAQAGLHSVEITAERPTDLPPDAWQSFRQSVSSAQVPDCFGQQAVPEAQGLLRAPVLAGAAAVDKCR